MMNSFNIDMLNIAGKMGLIITLILLIAGIENLSWIFTAVILIMLIGSVILINIESIIGISNPKLYRTSYRIPLR